jgi:hypothetical protein
MHHSTFVWIAASLVGILSVARTARLLIYDDLPPMVWLRSHIVSWYREDSKWSALWECPFCLAPYLMAGMGVWVWLSDLNTVWWVVNGWWAATYLAAIVVAYDQPED